MNKLHFTSKLEKGLLFDDTIFVLNNVYNLNTNSGQVTMLYSDKKGAKVNEVEKFTVHQFRFCF